MSNEADTALDPRALDAALNAVQIGDEETFKRSVIPAITAYLAATQPQAGEPVAEPCGGCGETNPDKRCIGCLHPFVAPASPQPALAVMGLGEWRRGYCDERVTIEQASTGFGSIYQVRVLDGIVWLDFPDQRKAEFGIDVEAAKAAAQADYEARIRSALVASAPPSGAVEAVGWLYDNEDTGREFSEQHPVESGEIPDATNIEPATADNLLHELRTAWIDLADSRQGTRALSITPATAEGWRLVPVEPTRDHLERLAELWGYTLEETADSYGAFLDALPAAPTATGGR